MSSNSDFTNFSRQSSKGIIVIYFGSLYKALKISWIFLFIFIRKFSQLTSDKLLYIFFAIIALLIFLLFRAYFIYKNFQFKIEGGYFILQRGVLKKTNTTIPFDRIQNINFKQNLIQQLINVYQVSIETAGSKKVEIAIKALSYKDAQALKNQLTQSIGFKNESLTEDLIKKKPLLTISFKELLKVSVTENHLQSLLLLAALVFSFFQQIEDILDGFGKKEILSNYIANEFNSLLHNILILTFLGIVLLILAMISSFVRVLLFHFNLTVFVKERSLEINQGLLTKKSIILKKEKVQSITVSTNPIKKIIGISFITFRQAVSGKVSQKKDKLIRIVGCKFDQIYQIKELLFDCKSVEKSELYKPNSYYKIIMYIRSFIGLFLLNSIVYLVFQDSYVLWLNTLFVPLILLLIRAKFNKAFYKFDKELLLIGNGRIETDLTYLSFFKVQNVKMRQTIFQERKKVIDLVLQTASGKVRIPCLELERAVKLYNYILFKTETSTKPWM